MTVLGWGLFAASGMTDVRSSPRSSDLSPQMYIRGPRTEDRGLRNLLPQHLERVIPLPGADAVDDPRHAHRLEVARGFDAAEVGDFPSPRFADLRHELLRVGVVAADEHRWWAAGEVGVDHVRIADGVERFHDARFRQPALHAFAEGVVETDGELRGAGREVERIRGVDDDLTVEIVRARHLDRALRPLTVRREHDDVAELRGVGERPGRCAVARVRRPLLQLLRAARADTDFMTELQEPAREHFSDVAGTEETDFHFFHGASLSRVSVSSRA